MTYHISSEWNLKDEVSGNKIEDKMSKNVGMESIDYERDWVKEVDSKGHVRVVLSLVSPH